MKPTIRIHDMATHEVIDREMTDAEYEMISKAVSASIEGYNKSIQVESTLKDDWGSNEGYSYKSVSNLVNESSPVLDQLISNKIFVFPDDENITEMEIGEGWKEIVYEILKN